MHVFLNGRVVPESEAVVSVFDRGFQYGDGLFETLRVANGRPFQWDQHLDRLCTGAKLLRIKPPFTGDELRRRADQLILLNKMSDAVLRIHLSRGAGPRGYSAQGADQPTCVMSLHALPRQDANATPPRWKLITSSIRLPVDGPFTRLKTANKLPQILARLQSDDAGADEALLLNTRGELAEGAASNLFWISGRTIFTPPLDAGALPGVTRAVVLELCQCLGIAIQESHAGPDALRQAEGTFLTLSTIGIAEAISLNGAALPTSPVTVHLWREYQHLLERESKQLRE